MDDEEDYGYGPPTIDSGNYTGTAGATDDAGWGDQAAVMMPQFDFPSGPDTGGVQVPNFNFANGAGYGVYGDSDYTNPGTGHRSYNRPQNTWNMQNPWLNYGAGMMQNAYNAGNGLGGGGYGGGRRGGGGGGGGYGGYLAWLQARADIGEEYQNIGERASQDLMSRGLANSSQRVPITLGIQRAKDRALQRLGGYGGVAGVAGPYTRMKSSDRGYGGYGESGEGNPWSPNTFNRYGGYGNDPSIWEQ